MTAMTATALTSFPTTLLAAGGPFNAEFVENLAHALIYSVLGMVLFALFWVIAVRVTPFSVRKEIEDDQNTALAVVFGAMIIGIAMIVSASILG